MPLPATRLIHPRWSAHHAPVLGTAMNATCWVHDPTRSTPGTLDPVTGIRDAPTLHYVAGEPEHPIRCRVQAVVSAQDTVQAGQTSTRRDYLVQLHDPALDLPDIEEGHVVRIVAAANDPHLVGADLHVDDVQLGSERFTRDLVAHHNQQPPGGAS